MPNSASVALKPATRRTARGLFPNINSWLAAVREVRLIIGTKRTTYTRHEPPSPTHQVEVVWCVTDETTSWSVFSAVATRRTALGLTQIWDDLIALFTQSSAPRTPENILTKRSVGIGGNTHPNNMKGVVTVCGRCANAGVATNSRMVARLEVLHNTIPTDRNRICSPSGTYAGWTREGNNKQNWGPYSIHTLAILYIR